MTHDNLCKFSIFARAFLLIFVTIFIFKFSVFCVVQTLTDTLCKQLGKHELKLNSKVLSLSYSHDGSSTSENWSLSCVANDDKHSQSSSVDAIIMTVSYYVHMYIIYFLTGTCWFLCLHAL